MRPFRILSIDGGGIKGVFPAAFLAALEEATGKRLADHFDLVAGTSTGGIIALGIGLGVPARDILAFYQRHGPTIFPKQGRWHRMFRWVARSKYRPKALRTALEAVFGHRRLGESETRLLIPSISAATGDVHIYKTPHHERLKSDYKQEAVDVALATSAAPTYFPVHRTPSGVQLMDGGLWANNPLMVAVVEAISLLGKSVGDIRALSVGCTATPMEVPWYAKGGGLATWARSAVDWLMHGQSVNALNQAGLLIGSKNILRVQHVVSPGIYSLDGVKAALQLEGPAREQARAWLSKIEATFLKEPKDPYSALYRVEQVRAE
jgi:hypothetical protein